MSDDTEFKKYITEYIIDRLDFLEGRSIYGCDLASSIYEADNVNGSITCRTAESRENLEQREDYFRNALGYMETSFGSKEALRMAKAYFDNPETAECLMVFSYVDSVINLFLGRHKYMGKDIWNAKVYIDKKFISWIKRNLKEAVDKGFEDMEDYGSD